MYFTCKIIVIIVICVIYCINNAVSRSVHKMAHHHRHGHHNKNNNNKNNDNNNNRILSEWKSQRKISRLSDFDGFGADKMAESVDKMADHMLKKRQNGRNVEDIIWKNLQQKIINHKTLDELLYQNVKDMESDAVCNYKITEFSLDEYVVPGNLKQITCNVGDLKEFCRGNNFERCCVQTYSKILVERKDGGGMEEVEINNGCIYAKLPEVKGLRADVETDY